jgi:DNA-binding transcriptional regulator YdaS (Cro superfamily)
MTDKALERAIKLAGGHRAVAKLFGIKPPAVYQWRRCPPHHVIGLARATDWQVTPHQLRPDLYPRDMTWEPMAVAAR